jgi:hypothetical protein
MLYLGIDLHRKQLTVSVRNEKGDVILRRQVSTRPERVEAFLKWIETEGGFVAIVETCGFEDWLIGLLKEHGCRDVVLIQPERRSRKKTDRRDAYVGPTDRGTGADNCRTIPGEPNGSNFSDVAGREHLQRFGISGKDRPDRELPPASQPGELLGADARVSQLRRGDGPVGLDHQAGQSDGPFYFGAIGASRLTKRSMDAFLVRTNQTPTWFEDRTGRSHATVGDHFLAHGKTSRTLHVGWSATATV